MGVVGEWDENRLRVVREATKKKLVRGMKMALACFFWGVGNDQKIVG